MNIDRINSVAQRIVLVSLNLGCWRATKLSRRETQKEREVHGNHTIRVTLRICEHPSLMELEQLHQVLYTEHKAITMPSVMDGLRVLPSGRLEEHEALIRDGKTEHDRLVAEFLQDYPREREKAQERLGQLYEPTAWPDPAVMPAKFTYVCRHLRCPTDGQWADWLAETVEIAQAEVRDRLLGAARHLAEVCKDGKLFQSAFDNLREIASLVCDDFNLLDDPIIARAAAELEKVADQDAASVRLDTKQRDNIAKRIDSILGDFKL